MIGPLVLLKKYDVPGSFQVKYYRPKSCCCFLTPGNVVSGSQSHANEILTAASGHVLHAVHRKSTNLLSWYLLCSQRENRHLGNVVLNSFHFYTRWNRWMDELGFLRPFNSISVIPRRWEGEHERLYAMKCRLGSESISPPAGVEPATPWSEVGSANRSAARTLLRWNWNNCGQLLI